MPFTHPEQQVIAGLQSLQLDANLFESPENKIARIARDIGAIGTAGLFGHEFMIVAPRLFAKPPDNQRELGLLRDVAFSARLDAVGYMLDDDIPIDEMTLNFIEPSVLSVEAQDALALKSYVLQVPVLSILPENIQLL